MNGLKKIWISILLFLTGMGYAVGQNLCNTNTVPKVVEFTEIVGSSGRVLNNTLRLGLAPVNGGFWITGHAPSTKTHGDQLFVAKCNDTGKMLFFNHYGNNYNEGGTPIASSPTSTGGVVVSAQSVNTSVNSNMSNISKFDKSGNLEWSRTTPTYGNSSSYDQFRDVFVDQSDKDNIYLVGTSTQRLGATYAELFLGKLDSSGNHKFLKYISIKEGTAFSGSHGIRVLPTKGKAKQYGDFLVVFWSGGGSAQRGGMVYLSKDGTIGTPWLGKLVSGNAPFSDIVFTESGNLFVLGNTTANGNSTEIVVYNFDPSNFNIKWQYTYGTTAIESQHSMILESGHLWVTGVSNGVSGGVNKRILLKLDTNGNIVGQWGFNNPSNSSNSFETLFGSQDEFATLSNGTSVFIGYTNSNSQNITLMFASPCSKYGCYFDTIKSITKRTFNYSGTNCNYSVTSASSFPTLTGLNVSSLNFKRSILCNIPCIAPRRALKLVDSVCVGGKVTVSARQIVSVTKPIKYLWNDGDTNYIKSFTSPGKYYLTTMNKCDTILDSILIKQVYPLSPFQIRDSLFCDKNVVWGNPYPSFRANYKWEDGSSSKTRMIYNPGKYWLTLGNYCGTVSDTFYLIRNLSPQKTMKSLDTFCKGNQILSIDAYQKDSFCRPANYKWLDGSGDSVLQVNNPGKYWVKTSNICGSRIDTIRVTQLDLPKTFDIKDTSYCDFPKAYNLDIAQTNCTYLWSTGSTLSKTSVKDTGKYWATVSNKCGSVSDSFTIVDYYSPERIIKAMDSVCNNGTASNWVDGKQKEAKRLPASYIWDTGETSSGKVITKSGVYVLTTQNRCGSRMDSLMIKEIMPPKPFVLRDSLFCVPIVQMNVNVYQWGCRYFWTDSDTQYAKLFNQIGKYAVTVTNLCGSESASFTISMDSLPTPILPMDKRICEGKIETLDLPTLNPSWKYSWKNGATVGPKYYLRSGDTMVLKIQSRCGNIADSIIGIKEYCLPCQIYMANAFTPFNNDGLNNEIKPLSNCRFKSGYWSVYNRWGQAIFERIPLTQAWDATYMGAPVIPGVYAFIIYGVYDRSDAGVFKLTGNITVLE